MPSRMILNHSFFLHLPFILSPPIIRRRPTIHISIDLCISTKHYQPRVKLAMVNLLTMKERIARCKRMVVDKTHPALTQGTSLFSETLKKRSGNSILDSHGVRVFDKNDNDEEILFFFCLVDECANDDCTGKKIKITTTSTNHAAKRLVLVDSGVLVRFS
jgi:hypothetical protein